MHQYPAHPLGVNKPEARGVVFKDYRPKTYSAVCIARITTGTLHPTSASMTITIPASLRIKNLEGGIMKIPFSLA
jgi:hypothetical protein